MLGGPGVQEKRLDLTGHHGAQILTGRVAEEPRGSEGFGYDPIFIPDGEDRTVAELGDAWKARNSHRARSAEALREVVDRRRGA